MARTKANDFGFDEVARDNIPGGHGILVVARKLLGFALPDSMLTVIIFSSRPPQRSAKIFIRCQSFYHQPPIDHGGIWPNCIHVRRFPSLHMPYLPMLLKCLSVALKIQIKLHENLTNGELMNNTSSELQKFSSNRMSFAF